MGLQRADVFLSFQDFHGMMVSDFVSGGDVPCVGKERREHYFDGDLLCCEELHLCYVGPWRVDAAVVSR